MVSRCISALPSHLPHHPEECVISYHILFMMCQGQTISGLFQKPVQPKVLSLRLLDVLMLAFSGTTAFQNSLFIDAFHLKSTFSLIVQLAPHAAGLEGGYSTVYQ